MRLAQRLNRLERTLGRLNETVVEVREVERTDEQWADWMGDFLWWPKGADMDRWPRTSSFAAMHDGPLRAWHEAAEMARQEGYRDYHVGLRPAAMAVWLDWKPRYLNQCRDQRAIARVHGEWVWDVPPRFNDLTMDEFKQLPATEQVAVLTDRGLGHWSKDPKYRRLR